MASIPHSEVSIQSKTSAVYDKAVARCPRLSPLCHTGSASSVVCYLGVFAKPYCQHRLFEVNPAVGDEVYKRFPPPAVWRKTTMAGSAPPSCGPHCCLQHFQRRNGFWPQSLLYTASVDKFKILQVPYESLGFGTDSPLLSLSPLPFN